MNNKLLLGAKYYRYEGDEIKLVRVMKFCSETELKITEEDTKETKKITIKELEENYICLNPHAIVNFCIAQLKDGLLDDVIVTVHKMSDLSSNEPTPYCVCRQNITDIFANQIQISNKMYVGCCMSLETCPPDVDYRIMIASDGIRKCISVCTYMDDTLDSILGFVKEKDYNHTLESLFADHVNAVVRTDPTLTMMKDRIMKLDSYDGYCKTLRLLLEQNNFMYDFYKTFNIIPIDQEVVYSEEGVVSDNIVEIISELYEVNIVSTFCMKYWYDIELSEINNDYVLIMDKNDNLFVVAFVSNGPKHINIENVESAENIERLANSPIGNNKSIKEAAEHIRLNKNKYN